MDRVRMIQAAVVWAADMIVCVLIRVALVAPLLLTAVLVWLIWRDWYG